MPKTRYVIIGGGLAGTLFTQTLEKFGIEDFLLVDAPGYSNSSRVAGGMFNPVVFRRLQKTWMADEIIPYLHDFYPDMEKKLGVRFFHPRKLLKILSDEEKAFWKTKTSENHYLSHQANHYFPQHQIYHPDGAGLVNQAGNVDTNTLLEAWHNFLKKKNKIRESKVSFEDIIIDDKAVRWKDVEAEYLIFAEGWKVTENPFFNYIPMKPAKGDVLQIEVPGFTTDHIINKKICTLPSGGNTFRVGATYQWENLNEIPETQSREEISQTLKQYLKLPFTIEDQKAAVRPVVGDRRPVLGSHPEHNRLLIFNGLGTKGVMLGPYFARHMVNHLEKNKTLMPEVNVERFQRRWFKKEIEVQT
ncbi:MAG: FAD-dependent oxidoreductase [Bacteroidales bacterium]|nr:FAD-dependent oxidoreductase [Bacteroidales bacterium]